MRKPFHATVIFACEGDNAIKVEMILKHEMNLDNVFQDTAIAFPGGVYEKTTTFHPVKDYFEISNVARNDNIVNLEVKLKENAGSFFKDILNQVVNLTRLFCNNIRMEKHDE